MTLYTLPRPDAAKLDRAINAAKEAYELKKSFNEKTKKDLKDSGLKSTPTYSPVPEKETSKDGSPMEHHSRESGKAQKNGSDGYKNGRRKHSPSRKRYSPASPRRKNDR